MKLEEKLESLSHSKFRSSFHLGKKEKKYIEEKGLEEIEKHTIEFLKKRLAPKEITNDGHQTPKKGHPTFIAQHATATCCRTCLYKWHHIAKNKELTKEEITYIKNIILAWIKKEIK